MSADPRLARRPLGRILFRLRELRAPEPQRPCPWCAGQRVIFEPARNGEGLVPHRCSWCCGVGVR